MAQRQPLALQRMIFSTAVLVGLLCALHLAPTQAAVAKSSQEYSCGGPVGSAAAAFKGSAWEVIDFARLKKFSHIWAFSDTHGHLKELKLLLLQAGLIEKIEDADEKDGTRLIWSPSRRSDLVIVVGDMIDDGDDSVDVVLFLDRIKKEAAAVGSKLVMTLGNHEARFLAHGSDGEAERDLVDSANASMDQLLKWDAGKSCNKFKNSIRGEAIRADELANSHFGCYLRNLPIGVVVGDWLFAHSGFLDYRQAQLVNNKIGSVKDYLATVSRVHRAQDFGVLGDDEGALSSLITRHDWWKTQMGEARAALACVGIRNLAIGHQAAALFVKDEEQIAISQSGWMIKLDSGLKRTNYVKKDDFHKGRILKCPVSNLLQGTGAKTRIELLSPLGDPLCRQIGRPPQKKKAEGQSAIEVDDEGEPLDIAPST